MDGRLLSAEDLEDARQKANLILSGEVSVTWHTQKAAEITLSFLEHITTINRELADARAVLRQIEWGGGLPEEPQCAVCFALQGEAHTNECELGRCLSTAPADVSTDRE